MKKRTLIENLQNPLKQLTGILLPHQEFKSIHDIFNPDLFYSLFLAFLPEHLAHQPKIDLKEDANESYRQMQTRKFEAVWETMMWTANQLNIQNIRQKQCPQKVQIQRMINNFDLTLLYKFVEVLFKIMVANKTILHLITEMEEFHQLQIKQFVEFILQEEEEIKNQPQSPCSPYKLQNNRNLVEKIYELEELVNIKEHEIINLKDASKQQSEEIEEYKLQIMERDGQILNLKKRILSYSEADLLFEEKDEEIGKLQAQLQNVKIQSHLKVGELTKELSAIKQSIIIFQEENSEYQRQSQKSKSKLNQVQVQKEEAESANKKVIQNLKEKIKNLNEKNTEQQRTIMEMLTEKEAKEKNENESRRKFGTDSKSKYQYFQDGDQSTKKKSSNKLGEELGEFNFQQENSSMKQYFEVLFGNTNDRCTENLCIAIRSQYVKIVHNILRMLNDLDGITFFSPETRGECMEDCLRKIEVLMQQNLKLKQKIILLQSDVGRGYPNKESLEEINKLKKKILILKRKLEETETQKKEQIEILIATFQESIPLKVKN